MRPFVVTAAIIRRRGRVLITQRRPGSALSMKWEFPGGTVRRGEELHACLMREILEELGVKIVVLKHYHKARYPHKDRVYEIHYFICRITKGELKALAVNDIRWVRPAGHASYRLLPPDEAIIKKLARQANNHR